MTKIKLRIILTTTLLFFSQIALEEFYLIPSFNPITFQNLNVIPPLETREGIVIFEKRTLGASTTDQIYQTLNDYTKDMDQVMGIHKFIPEALRYVYRLRNLSKYYVTSIVPDYTNKLITATIICNSGKEFSYDEVMYDARHLKYDEIRNEFNFSKDILISGCSMLPKFSEKEKPQAYLEIKKDEKYQPEVRLTPFSHLLVFTFLFIFYSGLLPLSKQLINFICKGKEYFIE